MNPDSKDPAKVAAGRLGGTRRWADNTAPRILKLDGLSREQRELVTARVRALRHANARAERSEAA